MANKQQDRKRKTEISTSFVAISDSCFAGNNKLPGVPSVPGGTSDHGKPNLVGFKIRMKCLNGVVSIGAVCIVASFAQALRALFPDNNPVSGYYEILALVPPVFYLVIMVAFNFQRFREELGRSIRKLKDTLCCVAPTQQPSPSGGSAVQRPRFSGRAMWRKYRPLLAFWAYCGSKRKATKDEWLEIPLRSLEE